MMKDKKKLLIIIPAYNEEKNIIKTYQRIKKLKIKNYLIDYIIINDGSTDNTKRLLEKDNLNYINLVNNLGIGGCMQTGYKYAYQNDFDFAVQFDGDGQHDEQYIKKLLKTMKINNVDFVIGSRFIDNLSEFKSDVFRRKGIKFLSLLIKIFTKKRIMDVTSGFRIANKEIISLFASQYPDDYPEPETIVFLIKKGYKIMEIPVKMQEREFGVSSITNLKSIYYMIKVSLAIIITSLSVREDGNNL